MSQTVYISDLDGTLLNSEGRVSDNSARIISRLCRHGVRFTVATARTVATVRPLLTHIDLGKNPEPWILMTGAMTYNASTDCASFRGMNASMCRRLDEAFARFRFNPFVYMANHGEPIHIDVYHKEMMSKVELAFYRQRKSLMLKTFHFSNHPERYYIADTDRLPDFNTDAAAPLLYLGMGEPEPVFLLADHIRAIGGFYVSAYIDTYDTNVAYIEVFGDWVSKAKAINSLYEGCRKVVFGDNLNDIEMMHAADVAVAVGNANSRVKEVADIIIGTNDTDAVARFILNENA